MTVLSLASTGTVVSAPCRLSAAITCASINATRGASAAVQPPTQSARVETLSSMPSAAKRSLWRFRGWGPPHLACMHHRRQQLRPSAAARNRMERGRRLGDRLAGAAGELLPNRLDHFEAARDALQRL